MSQRGVGKKPKTIRPYKSSMTMNEDHFLGIWDLLKSAIYTIYRSEQSSLSFEELYRNAYNMVLHKHGDMLYKGLKDVISEHLRSEAELVNSARDPDFLGVLNKVWQQHTIALSMIRDILMYMDRNYVETHKVLSVNDLGITLFRDLIVRCPDFNGKLRERLPAVILANIKAERQGDEINRSLMRHITNMLIHLGLDSSSVYEVDFEKPFLAATVEFYALESQTYLAENDAGLYIRKAERRLKEEDERVDHYLDQSTRTKLIRVVEKELISSHIRKILEMENTGLVAMLQNEKYEDLPRLYHLLARVSEGLNEMRAVIMAYVVQTGDIINSDPDISSDPVKWVQSIMNMKDKYDRLLESSFERDKNFQTTINDAFKKFICKNARAPEFLSLFLDENLKKGIKGLSEEEIELTLDKSVVLFRFLEEKDVFERYYKQHLAKRLLMRRSVSDDAERNMITKLKTECGYQFTSKLEGMFTDMRLSDDLMAGFRDHLHHTENDLNGIDLTVTVLTNTFWPVSSAAFTCKLPPQILSAADAFTKFYLGRHSGRRLTWQTNMGIVDLRANYPKRKHEITVSVPMMSILLQFNDRDSMTYQELAAELDIPDVELKRNLQAIVFGKYKLLLKEPKGSRDIEPTDQFIYNDKFSASLVRLKIQQLANKAETEIETRDTRDRIDEDRKHQIDACIVRIMKSRKTLEHNNLVAEVAKQLNARFAPNPNVIKKRIESLIEREFLERANDIRVYNYVA